MSAKRNRPTAKSAPSAEPSPEIAKVVKSIAETTPANVLADIASLQVGLSKSLADLSATVTQKFQTVSDLDVAISAKKEYLERLYAIDAAQVDLESLKEQAEAQRAELAAERERFQAEIDEEDRAVTVRRKRDDDQYTYDTMVRRRAEEDKFKAKLADLEANYRVRSEALSAREGRLAELENDAAEFESRLAEAVASASAKARSESEAHFQTQMKLLEASHQTQLQVVQQQLRAATAANESLQNNNQRLQAEIAQVRADAKDIAQKALESAAQSRSSPTFVPYPSTGGVLDDGPGRRSK